MKQLMIIFIIYITLIASLIPHLANTAPMIPLVLVLGSHRQKLKGFLLIVTLQLFITLGLHWLRGYPLFGSWLVFQLSAYAGLIALSRLIPWQSLLSCISSNILSALLFWLWTNFGVWLCSGMYDLSLKGLIACYLAAIPFLKYSLLGCIAWGVGFYKMINKPVTKYHSNTRQTSAPQINELLPTAHNQDA